MLRPCGNTRSNSADFIPNFAATAEYSRPMISTSMARKVSFNWVRINCKAPLSNSLLIPSSRAFAAAVVAVIRSENRLLGLFVIMAATLAVL